MKIIVNYLVSLLTIFYCGQYLAMHAPQARADVTLKNVVNRTDSNVKVLISGVSLQDPSVTLMSFQEFKPGITSWNKELRSKKTAHPQKIRLVDPIYKNWEYSPSGNTPAIDLVIEKNKTLEVVPAQAVTEQKKPELSAQTIVPKAGIRPVQFETVVIKKINNQSPEDVLIEASGEIYQIEPNKENKINFEVKRGNKIIIHTSTPKGDESTSYVPSGKSENIDIIVDADGNVQVREAHEQSPKKVHFDQVLHIRPIPKIGKRALPK